MPKCKNDSTRSYKGNEPSPKGFGYCGHAEKLGKKRKGIDGSFWIVVKNKSGIKRWTKLVKKSNVNKLVKKSNVNKLVKKSKVFNKKEIPDWKKITLLKEFKKSAHSISLENWFQIKVIQPNDIKRIISKPILNKIIDVIKPLLNKYRINVFIVPRPVTEDGKYLTDYPYSYISNFYESNWSEYSFITLTIDLNTDLSIIKYQPIIIDGFLYIYEQQIVFNTLISHFPYRFKYKTSEQRMTIEWKKTNKKQKHIKICNIKGL